MTFRPVYPAQLAGEWVVEAVLAQDAGGTITDPIIMRDGPRGRLVPAFQNTDEGTPKGLVAAEIIVYVMDVDVPPTAVGIAGLPAGMTNKPLQYRVQLLEDTGSPRPSSAAVTVNLASDSATGKFDTDPAGTFAKTSVTVPAGETSAVIYYRDTATGTKTLTASSAGLTSGTKEVRLFAQSLATPGEVLIYTGTVNWIDKGVADQQAQICVNKLNVMGVANSWISAAGAAGETEVADWVSNSTGNGQLDVLVIYGYLPPTIYVYGNSEVDGSLAELFIETEDGDAIINHADYFFYVTGDGAGGLVANGDLALMQIMDIPGMSMWGDNTPMVVTADGAKYAPSLTDFLTDRPFNLGYLAAQVVDWYPELILAQNAAGTLSEPIIVRDGDRGRLIPVFQASFQDDPKGAVAAEIIAYLHGINIGDPAKLGIVGRAVGMQGRPLQFTVQVQDLFGSPADAPAAITVNLSSTSGTGRFDTAADGSFNGSVTSVSIPAGGRSATIFYKDTNGGTPTLTASTAGLTQGTLALTIFAQTFATPGEVAIWTGATWWIDKAPPMSRRRSAPTGSRARASPPPSTRPRPMRPTSRAGSRPPRTTASWTS